MANDMLDPYWRRGLKQHCVILTDPYDNFVPLESNGSLPVTLQDQTSPAIIAPVRKEKVAPTTLASDFNLGDRVMNVADETGIAAGDRILLRSVADNRFSFFTVVSTNVTAITVDSPSDFDYTVANTTVNISTDNLAVNGSVTPQVFALRGDSSPDIATTADITRLIFVCTCSSAVDLNKFGDIAGGLLNGIVVRHRNGITQNLFNLKTNLGFAGIAYDFTVYSASNPQQGINGFACRLTFAGQNKMGVTIRLEPDEDLEVLVQDDLSSLVSFHITAEGHVVT